MATRVGPPVMLAVSLAVIAAGTWRWQQSVFHAQRGDALTRESWDRVKEEYPIAQESPHERQTRSTGFAEAVVGANPFSPKRRLAPTLPGGETGATGGLIKPPAPVFIYKGQINVGKRQRAIVEESASHKTYFLEVGQEVAGFKVLDIAENRVVLSDLATHEEVVVSLSSKDER
jgi:hypothetical protein